MSLSMTHEYKDELEYGGSGYMTRYPFIGKGSHIQ